MLRFKALATIGFTCLLIGCSGTGSESLKKMAPHFQTDVFHPANQPSFNLKKINENKPVLLVFWATWCESCKAEIPALNHYVEEYSGKLEIASIDVQEEKASVRAFLSNNSIQYRVLLDESGAIADLFEVTAIPSVLLLAKGGEILYYGFRLPSPQELDAAIYAV